MEVRALQRADAQSCDAIIAGLPDWFGDAQGLIECAKAVRSHDGLVAVEPDGAVAAFLTWQPREEGSAEITWMAVRTDRRRAGLGRQLLDRIATELRASRVTLLLVKSLSERAGPYPPYEQTRAFYRAQGFVPVAELDIWGPENPATLFAKPL